MTKTDPRPPKHLKPATRRWWRAVVEDWRLEEHHVRLLTLAAESWDRGVAAREAIERDGVTVSNRWGETKAHPLVNVERDCKILFSRLVRELDLDLTAPPESASRPLSLRSIG